MITEKRFKELSELKDGWLNGEGKAPSRGALLRLRNGSMYVYDARLPMPRIYPTIEGNISAEWSINGRELTAEIDLETGLGEWMEFNPADSRVTVTADFDLSNPDGWRVLNDLVRQATNG